MAKNIFVKVPSVGDAVVGNIKTKEVKFIAAKTFSLADLDTATYETIGVVYARHGRQVKIAYKKNETTVWVSKVTIEIKGAQTDGVQHTGTISYRASEEAPDNTDVIVTYTATTLQQVADAINATIANQPAMVAQHWAAYVEGEKLVVAFDYLFWQQSSYNGMKAGFTANKEHWLNGVPYTSQVRRKNGFDNGEGAIHCLDRAIYYYRVAKGTASNEGNVDKDIANFDERSYPINKTTYLGQAADGKDHCAALRAMYGEGEQGWLNSLKACMAIYPADVGIIGERRGLELTKALVAHKDQDGKSFAPAAEYCLNTATVAMPAGSFYLPTVEDLYDLMSVVKLGTGTAQDCPVNSTMQAMQGMTISNGSYWWSCCRFSLTFAWYSNGYGGFVGNYEPYNKLRSLPVSNYYLND